MSSVIKVGKSLAAHLSPQLCSRLRNLCLSDTIIYFKTKYIFFLFDDYFYILFYVLLSVDVII